MLAAVAPLPPELIGTEAAAGRTLADTLQAARAQPPFRSSAMDGYGVRAADLALGRFTVLGEALAGKRYAGGPVGTSGAVWVLISGGSFLAGGRGRTAGGRRSCAVAGPGSG